jgi:uncharacterized protein (TIGR03437 family)
VLQLLVFLCLAQDQPRALFPNVTGVVNGASFQSGIVAGSWATILGTDLATTTRAWAASDFLNSALPPNLNYTGATVNGKTAFVGYVSPTQVNILLPDDAALGMVTVQITTEFINSNIVFANKVAAAPALFTVTTTYPAAVHNADGTYAGPTSPVHPGEVIQLFGTGFGATNPVIPTGMLFTTPAPLAQSLKATLGGVPANADAYLVGPGVYQINLTVPTLAAGDAALSIAMGSSSTQPGLMLPIAN